MIEFASQLSKAQFITAVLTAVSSLFCFIAILTPSWQVAEDLDANRSVQSGLWIYCPGASQCWYIFSDSLINYYERVDVCRFFLIGDCRKKLLRTPYFFGWHYAVLILILVTLLFCSGAIVALGVAHFKPRYARISVIMLDVFLSLAFLLLCIALAVFMINAEMLESRFLIGVKNTFEKSYGYSFYLACIGLTVLMFAVMGAVFITTSAFFLNGLEQTYANDVDNMNGDDEYPTSDYILRNGPDSRKYKMMQEAPSHRTTPTFENVPPRYCYSPDMSIPTRTFLSY